MTMLTNYFASVAAQPNTKHRSTFRERLGDDVVDLLLAERVLFDAGTAEWYPCGGHCGEQRPVLDEGTPANRPFYAPCAVDDGCMGDELAAGDLQLYGHSFTRLVEILCRALAIEPAPNPEVAITRGVHRLGTARRRGVPTDVFLAIAPEHQIFPLFVAARANASRKTWIVATTLRWVPDALIADHGPSAPVELAALDDLLATRQGRIVPILSVAPTVAAPPAALLVDRTGTRALSTDEYEDLVEHAGEHFDQFVDVATEHKIEKRRFCKGGRRSGDGRFREVDIPTLGAHAIAELMEVGRDQAVLPKKLPSLAGSADAAQILRKAWKLIDPECALRSCSNLAYRFDPKHDTRWGIVKRAPTS